MVEHALMWRSGCSVALSHRCKVPYACRYLQPRGLLAPRSAGSRMDGWSFVPAEVMCEGGGGSRDSSGSRAGCCQC